MKSGDYVPQGYDDLYNYYFNEREGQSFCTTIIRRFVKNGTKEELEDIKAEAYARCVEKNVLDRFDGKKGNFGGVVYCVCRTVSVSFLRKKGRDPLGTLREDEEAIEGEKRWGEWRELENEIDRRRMVKSVVRFVEVKKEKGKTKRDKKMVDLVKLLWEGSSLKESAKSLGVTEMTVRNWIAYIRRGK